jgi:hypothetical protein
VDEADINTTLAFMHDRQTAILYTNNRASSSLMLKYFVLGSLNIKNKFVTWSIIYSILSIVLSKVDGLHLVSIRLDLEPIILQVTVSSLAGIKNGEDVNL